MKSQRILRPTREAALLFVAMPFVLLGCSPKPIVGAFQQAARSKEHIAALTQCGNATKSLVLAGAKTKTYPKSLEGIDCGRLQLQLNPKLAGVSFKAVKYPAKTVLVYEGAPGAPLYSHNGWAALGFADGHTKMMKAEAVQAQQLRWEP